MRDVRFLFAATLLGLSACVSPPAAERAEAPRAAEPAGTAREEVTRALYDSWTTRGSVYFAEDPGLEALRANIEEMEEKEPAARAALTDARERYMAELARQDRVYAEDRAALRRALERIASTPEGLQALARFNRGDRRGAVERLDELRAEAGGAEEGRSDKERAADARAVAVLMRHSGEFEKDELIARFEEITRLDPDVQRDWLALTRLYEQAMRLDDALQAARTALRTANTDPQRAIAQRELGTALFLRGNHQEGMAARRQAVDIRRRLAKAEPDAPGLQRDLLLDLSVLAMSLVHMADWEGALTALRERGRLLQRLADTDPAPVPLRADLARNFGLIAAVLATRGDMKGAEAEYRKGLEIARRLAATEPDFAGLQRSLRIGLNDVAWALAEKGETERAMALYRENIESFRRLDQVQPSRANGGRDVAVTLARMGAAQEAAGNPEAALAAYREALEIHRRRLENSALPAYEKSDVIEALHLIGALQRARGNLDAALAAWRESLEIARTLIGVDNPFTDGEREVLASLHGLGDVLFARQDFEGALKAYREALEIARRRVAADDASPADQGKLWESLGRIGRLRAARNNVKGALAAYGEALDLSRRMMKADPSSAAARRGEWIMLWHLAAIPESGVSWAEVVAAMEETDRRGLLLPEDRRYLEEARRRAASEKKGGQDEQQEGAVSPALLPDLAPLPRYAGFGEHRSDAGGILRGPFALPWTNSGLKRDASR